jgi:mannonate dehydratase
VEKKMRIAVGQFSQLTDETLTFAQQLGIKTLQMNTPQLPGEHRWEYEDLLALKRKCDEYGLVLESIENVPIKFYDKIMLGLPGRDEQIEHYKAIISNMGRAGIPILGHHFMPNFVWRTTPAIGRGGVRVTAFDAEEARSGINSVKYDANREVKIEKEDVMWEHYEYFLKAVLPVAEESGVRLALHPDDPPVQIIDGVARLFYKVDNFKKAMELADSDAWGLNLCLGCCSEMINGASNVMEMIRFFGPRGKIFYIHFRDVQGTVPKFQECFLGEGNFDPAEVLLELKRNGFNGFILDDHVPAMINDSPWGHRARAHAIGYIQGLINMAEFVK